MAATGIAEEWLANHQIRRYYERGTDETVKIEAPISFYDDFVGTALGDLWWTAFDAGNGEQRYTTATTEPNGALELLLTSTSQAQRAGISFNNVLAYRTGSTTVSTRFLQFETRLKVVTLPTTGTGECQAFWGLGNLMVVDPDSATQRMLFHLNSATDSGARLMTSTNDGVTDAPNEVKDRDTGVDLVADDQYRIYRIDCSDLSEIKFYVDGIEVSTDNWNPHTLKGLTAAKDGFQPFLSSAKTGANTAECKIMVDYVRVWGIR